MECQSPLSWDRIGVAVFDKRVAQETLTVTFHQIQISDCRPLILAMINHSTEITCDTSIRPKPAW